MKCVLTVLLTQYCSGDKIEQNEMGGARSALWGEGRGVYTGLWWGNLRERDHWGDRDVDGEIILRWIYRKWDAGLWTGSNWLRIGTGGGLL